MRAGWFGIPPNGWALLGFRDTEDGVFVGEITDPIPVVLDAGRMRIVG
jgi:beta-fructofuranosidase